jgi:uncharacterized membrane protein YgcG
MSRIIRLLLVALIASLPPGLARAQEKTPFPPFTGERVYVVGGAERFDGVAAEIKRLESSTPLSYYVVVIPSFGKGAIAPQSYANELEQSWRGQAVKKRLEFDAPRSVIVVLALRDRKVIVHTGRAARERFGLSAAKIQEQLIEPVFIPSARDGKYAEGLSGLLTGLSRLAGAQDQSRAERVTRSGQDQAQEQPATAAPPARATTATPPARAAAPAQSAGLNLPLLAGILVAVLLVVAALLLWLAHSSFRRQVNRRIKEFRTRSVAVMDRLDALKERLKLLPTEDPDFKAPLSGQTLALYGAVQARLGSLWERWLEIMEALDKAQKLAGSTGSPFDQKKLQQADAILNPAHAFEEIEAQATGCAADMDRLNQAHEAAHQAQADVAESQKNLDGGLESVRQLELPVAPYADELQQIRSQLVAIEANVTPDPIGSTTALKQLAARIKQQRDRVQRVVTLTGQSQELRTSVDALVRDVSTERAGGLTLAEEGGNPDQFLGKAAQLDSETKSALSAGDPDIAAKKLESARQLYEQAVSTIDEVKKARAYCQAQQADRVRDTQLLRAAVPEAESYEQELKRDFAPSSWQALAGNLAQARALLATFDGPAADAAAAAASTSQRYLEAARLLQKLASEQTVARRLMSALSERLRDLQAVRSECEKTQNELDRRFAEVQDLLSKNAQLVGDLARNSFAAASKARTQALAGFRDPRPDWPAISQNLAGVLEELAIAQSHAETDLQNHQRLTEEFARVRPVADRVYSLLASHTEDRLAANQHYQAAADALDRVGVELPAPRGESARLLDQVERAAADLETAQRMALEDIRLAGQAQAEIGEATRSIRAARTFFSFGITVETASAESDLDQASRLLETQQYEQAIARSGAAMRAVNLAHNAAVQQAQWRQMQQDADLRRRNAGTQIRPDGGIDFVTTAAGAGAILDQLGRTAAAPSPTPAQTAVPGPQASEPPSAVGSWSSDDAQGAW